MINDIKTDKNGRELSWRNDPYWHNADTKLPLTKEHVLEFKKCKEDIIYFIKNYVYFTHPEKGLTKVSDYLYDWQIKFLKLMQLNKYIVGLLPRQSGKSTTFSWFMTWYLCFNKDRTSAIVANKEEIAKEIFSRTIISLKYVPHFLKAGVEYKMKLRIDLDNGSRLVVGATSESGLSGFTVNGVLLCDEVAKIAASKYHAFIDSMAPTIARAQDSKMVRISTPVGMNHWYRIVQKAMKPESDEAFFTIKWNEIPGRDEKFKQSIIGKFGLDHWFQEYECKFLSSVNSLISGETTEQIELMEPIETKLDGFLKIYEQPKEDHYYIITCDCGEGTGQDYSICNVTDISIKKMKQCAVYRSNTIEPTLFPDIINTIGKMYNTALVIVENNNIGHLILNILLNNIEYENLWHYKEDRELGIRTTNKIKNIGASRLRELIENDGYDINDFNTVEEMSTFVYKRGIYRATSGSHDDICMALILFSFFTTTDYFKELKNNWDFIDSILENKRKNIGLDDLDEEIIIHVDGNETKYHGFNNNDNDITYY